MIRKSFTHKDIIHRHGAVSLLDIPVSQFHDQRFTSNFCNGCKDKLEIFKGIGALLQVLGQGLEKKGQRTLNEPRKKQSEGKTQLS